MDVCGNQTHGVQKRVVGIIGTRLLVMHLLVVNGKKTHGCQVWAGVMR